MNAPKSRIPVLLVLLALTVALAVWVQWPVSGNEATMSQTQAVQPVIAPAPQAAVVQIEPQQQQPAETPVATVKSEPRKYVVVLGDKLTARFGKNAMKVCELSKLKDCNRIYPNQELFVPNDMEIVGSKPVQRLADGSLPIARLAVDPYRPYRTPEKDRKILASHGYTSAEIAEYFVLRDQGKCVREDFSRGTKFLWMSSGNARVLENLVAVWKQPEVGLVCQLQSGRNVVIMEKCDNLTEVAPRPPKPVEPKPVPLVETPKVSVPRELPPVVPPTISAIPAKNVMREVAEYEAIVGDGVWDNRLAHGDWQYGEASIMAILPDGHRLGGGVYGMRGSGESDNSAYSWKEHGWGPQLVLKKNFTKEHEDQFGQSVEYPAMWGIKFRHIGNDYVSGGNPVSGYHQTQTGKKNGVFAEYGEQVSLDWKWGVTGEIWESYDRKIASTWSGDKPQDRGSWALNAYAQQRLNDDWQVRYVAGASHQNWDDLDYLNLQAEARYKETVMCGPRVSLALNHPETYRGIAQSDLTTWGAFCRVETFGVIRAYDKQEREDAVQKVGTVPLSQAAVAPVSSDKGGDQETERILQNIASLGT